MCLVSKQSNMWNGVVSILVFHAVSFISQLESNFRAVRCFVCHVRWPNATLGHQLAPLKGFSSESLGCTKSYMRRYQVCSFSGKETCINSIMAHSEEVGTRKDDRITELRQTILVHRCLICATANQAKFTFCFCKLIFCVV